MAPVSHLSPLNDTVTARWLRGLVGQRPGEKSHWRTKTAYYLALHELLAGGPESELSWRAIVNAVRPKGNPSTFYEVTGPHAKHPLIGDFVDSERVEALELAWRYRRSNAVHQLIDETKVWAYWPHRDGWLIEIHHHLELGLGVPAAVDALAAVVGGWARTNPGLAAALDYAPPACAVEDLLVLCQGQLSAGRAFTVLAHVLERALSAPTELTAGLLDVTIPEVGGTGNVRSVSPETVLVGLAEQIHTVNQESRRFAPSDEAMVRRLATELMRDAVTTLA